MNLRQYRIVFGVMYRHIADKCDCTPEMISMIAAGKAAPSFALALRIEKATYGYVRRDNWYPPYPADVSITIGGISV